MKGRNHAIDAKRRHIHKQMRRGVRPSELERMKQSAKDKAANIKKGSIFGMGKI